MVKTALTHRKTDTGIGVPWTGFDLINVFNAWKKTADAGRTFTVDTEGTVDTVVTDLRDGDRKYDVGRSLVHLRLRAFRRP